MDKLIEAFAVFKEGEKVSDDSFCGVTHNLIQCLVEELKNQDLIKIEFDLRYPDKDGYYSRASIVVKAPENYISLVKGDKYRIDHPGYAHLKDAVFVVDNVREDKHVEGCFEPYHTQSEFGCVAALPLSYFKKELKQK